MFTEEVAVNVTNGIYSLANIEEVVETNKEESNDLLKLDPKYFLENATNRLKKLKRAGVKKSIDKIVKYLMILALTEQNKEGATIKDFNSTNFSNRSNSSFIKLMIGNDRFFNEYFYIYQANRMPFCCGVTEYGNFSFREIKLVDKDLVFNLILDLIRLSASNKRALFSGALGVINYFINTPFMKVIENRDDLRFVEQFTNPKTSHKLKMFIFNTKI